MATGNPDPTDPPKTDQVTPSSFLAPAQEVASAADAVSSDFLAFIEELSLQASYESVLDCTAVWLQRLIPNEYASLTLPVALRGNWSIGGPKELEVIRFQEGAAVHAEDRFPVDGSRAGEAFVSGRLCGADDHSEDQASDLVALTEDGVLSARFAPLIAGGRTIGTVNVGRTSTEGFSRAEERILRDAATVIAGQCLLHQRLAEAHKAAAQEAENSRIVNLLQRFQLKLAHLSDEQEVCLTTATYIKRIFRLNKASLALLGDDEEMLSVRTLTRKQADSLFDFHVPLAGSVFEPAIRQKRVVTWKKGKAPSDVDGVALEFALMGLEAGITAPLASGNEVLGTLNLASDDADVFTQVTISKITEVGRIVGTALASIRAHNALKAAQEDAEAASASKGAFLANVSHELRTPLNGVLGMAQLLEGTALDEEQSELVGTIKSSGQLLMRVISDVLEVSKIESGSIVLEAIDFDPSATVEKACAMVAPAAHSKGLQIGFTCDPEIPARAMGDPTRLQQIVVNLLSNAVKFTTEGGVFVTVALKEVREKDQLVEIAVRDTGKGIAADAIDRIFVPFQQEEASTTRRFGGTGLGLAICKQFAELMGGDVSATSIEGEGSTFSVRIVLGKASNEAPSRNSEAEQGQCGAPAVAVSDELAETFQASAPLKVLVVDDNPVNRRVAERLLQRLGYEPALAPSGQAAIDATAAEAFDLVLMDLSMPEIDGFEASAAIQSRLATPPTIVALTADVQESTRERCLEEGMYDLLAKPFSVASLKSQLLDVYCMRKSSSSEAA